MYVHIYSEFVCNLVELLYILDMRLHQVSRIVITTDIFITIQNKACKNGNCIINHFKVIYEILIYF